MDGKDDVQSDSVGLQSSLGQSWRVEEEWTRLVIANQHYKDWLRIMSIPRSCNLPIQQDSTDFVDCQYSSGFATGFLQFAQTYQISAAACLAV